MATPTRISSRKPPQHRSSSSRPSSKIDRASISCPSTTITFPGKEEKEASKRYTRLHITPLDADLAKLVLSGPALSAAARNVSFHAVATFPERRYGFVDLPADDADRLRRKLNGAVLKGVKIRIEQARKEGEPAPLGAALALAATTAAGAAMGSSKKTSKDSGAAAAAAAEGGGDHDDGDRRDAGATAVNAKLNKSKKRKHNEVEVLSGVLLEEGRKVKRGWTVSPQEEKRDKEEKKKEEVKEVKEKIEKKRREKEKRDRKNSGAGAADNDDDEDEAREGKKDRKEKKREKRRQMSKFTDDPECLVKTVLPPGRSTAEAPAEEEDQPRKKKRKSAKSRETVVIHEFENTTKFPTFLRSTAAPATSAGKSSAAAAAEYVDGKGWVDAEGNVVEPVKSTRPVATRRSARKRDEPRKTKNEETPSSHDSSDASDHAPGMSKTDDTLPTPTKQKASDSGSSSNSDCRAESEENSPSPTVTKSTTEPAPAAPSMLPPLRTAIVSPSARQAPLPSPPSISVSRPRSSGSSRSLTIKIPGTTTTDTTNTTTTTTSADSATPGSQATSGHPTPLAAQQREVHPLEALYKRPKPAADGLLTAATTSSSTAATLGDASGPSTSTLRPFSFFGSDNTEDGEDGDDHNRGQSKTTRFNINKKAHGSLAVPMTPFTKQDFESRGLRSAAPTPDTARPGRKFRWGAQGKGNGDDNDDDDADDDDEEEEEEEGKDYNEAKGKGLVPKEKQGEDDDDDDDGNDDDDDEGDKDSGDKDNNAGVDSGDGRGEGAETGFQAWFWENRGGLNRAWKKRRKLAGKEKRYRDNKARGSRLT